MIYPGRKRPGFLLASPVVAAKHHTAWPAGRRGPLKVEAAYVVHVSPFSLTKPGPYELRQKREPGAVSSSTLGRDKRS